MKRQVNVSIDEKYYTLLVKEAGHQQLLTGKIVSLGSLIAEIAIPVLEAKLKKDEIPSKNPNIVYEDSNQNNQDAFKQEYPDKQLDIDKIDIKQKEQKDSNWNF